MKIVFYILLPIILWLISMVSRGVIAILTGPIVWLQEKIDHNSSMHKFRSDMIISGFVSAFLGVYSCQYLNIYLKLDLSIWGLMISAGIISFLDIYNWNKNNPFWYETCLNIPPSLGYIFAIIYFIN